MTLINKVTNMKKGYVKTLKIYFYVLAVASIIGQTSCSSDSDKGDIYGQWDPIQVDKEKAVMDEAGGCDTIRLQNYDVWMLSSGTYARVNGVTEHRIGDKEGDTPLSMDGEWFSLRIPEDNLKLLIINCDPNINHDKRELFICVTVGDAFKTLSVVQ